MTKNDKIISLVPDVTLFSSTFIAYFFDREFPIAPIASPFRPVGWLLIGGGVFLAAYTITLIRKNNVTSNVADVPRSLLRRGPYAYTRNPFYLSYIIVSLGVAFAFASVGAFTGVILNIVVLNGIIRFEERRLRRVFGSGYEHYAQSVRRWM